jgi:hypothetical protein
MSKILRKIRNKFLLIKIGIFLLPGLFLIFSQIKAEDGVWEITQSTEWSGEIEIDRNVYVKNGAMLDIKPGTVIKFNRRDGQKPPSIFIEKGSFLLAEGNEKEKIKFTSDQDESCYSLIFDGYNNGLGFSGFLRYVEISKAGGYCPNQNQQVFNFFIPRVFAQENWEDNYYPVLHRGGTLIIENSEFKDNNNSDIFIDNQTVNPDNFINQDSHLVSVINSNFSNNKNDIALVADFDCSENCEELIFLKNNWYGKPTGPNWVKKSWDYYQEHEESFEGFIYGQKVIGSMLKVSDFRTKTLIADPVIIIPGIMGSGRGMIGNKLVLDPILHTYDDLIESLENNGYEKNKNLFTFPYNWRNSNEITAVQLSEKISEIEEDFWSVRIDVVAHSMGGLVARQSFQNAEYLYNIDQFITLGTPHQGAPKAYLQWEAGEDVGNFSWLIAKHHFLQEAQHNNYDDLHKYIQEKVLSVKELLPNYDYLFDVEKDKMRDYPGDYPENSFLENLNDPEKLENLNQLRTYNIVGKKENKNTINKIRVVESQNDEKWEHGYPEKFDDNLTDRGIEFGIGDETVPIESALGINFDQNIELDSNHNELPAKAQCEIFGILSGEKVCFYDEDLNIPNFLLFNVFSPVDIQVVLEDGRRIGTDFETGESINELEDLGAYYTGNNTENEFITIPNYLEGKYKILTSGTDSGEFRIEVTSFKDTNEYEAEEEQIKEIKGETFLDEIQSFEFVVGDENDENNDEAENDTKILLDETGDGNDDEDEKKEDDEDDDEEDEDKEISSQSEGFLIQNFAETDLSQQNSTERGAEQEIVDKKIIKEEKQPQTKIAGDQNRKNNYWMIILIFLVGGIALFLTWTVNWTFKKKIVKMKKP